MRLSFASATWLKQKFLSALNRRNDARSFLAGLYQTQNPYATTNGNHTNKFFISQWTAQRRFQTSHTEAEQEQGAKLVKLYRQEEALENLRYVSFLLNNFKESDGVNVSCL